MLHEETKANTLLLSIMSSQSNQTKYTPAVNFVCFTMSVTLVILVHDHNCTIAFRTRRLHPSKEQLQQH